MQETEHKGFSEDWLALCLGLVVFALSLGVLGGVDVFGWAVKTNVWIHLGQAIAPFSARFAHLPAVGSLLLTFAFMTSLMAVCAKVLGADVKKFLVGLVLIVWISYGCWLLGNNAYIAAT